MVLDLLADCRGFSFQALEFFQNHTVVVLFLILVNIILIVLGEFEKLYLIGFLLKNFSWDPLIDLQILLGLSELLFSPRLSLDDSWGGL